MLCSLYRAGEHRGLLDTHVQPPLTFVCPSHLYVAVPLQSQEAACSSLGWMQCAAKYYVSVHVQLISKQTSQGKPGRCNVVEGLDRDDPLVHKAHQQHCGNMPPRTAPMPTSLPQGTGSNGAVAHVLALAWGVPGEYMYWP